MDDKSVLSSENISLFIKFKEESGLQKETIKSYKRNLMWLFDAMPDGKELCLSDLEDLVHRMVEDGVQPRTINHRIGTWNSFFAFNNRLDLQLTPSSFTSKTPTCDTDTLTRSEYLQLLTAARKSQDMRCFYLIRTLGSIPIRVSDLDLLTVQFINSTEEYLDTPTDGRIRVPHTLKKALIEYATWNGISAGPVFLTNTGMVCDRSFVHKVLSFVSQTADVPENKVTANNIRKLCIQTYDDVFERFRDMIDRTYDNVLEIEQQMYSWI